MNRLEILQTINMVFREVLDIDELSIFEHTSSRDIDEWDSLNHIHLVVEIEKKFKIRFTANEIQSWTNVSDMINNIQKNIE